MTSHLSQICCNHGNSKQTLVGLTQAKIHSGHSLLESLLQSCENEL